MHTSPFRERRDQTREGGAVASLCAKLGTPGSARQEPAPSGPDTLTCFRCATIWPHKQLGKLLRREVPEIGSSIPKPQDYLPAKGS